MRVIRCLAALFALAALSACVQPQQASTAQTGRSVVVPLITEKDSGPVQPGDAVVGMTAARGIFDRICVRTYPNIAKAEAVVKSLPFRRHPETGTYYHRDLDLSIKLISGNGGACSMVFGSRETADFLGIGLATAVSTTGEIGIDPGTGSSIAVGPAGSQFAFRPVAKVQGRTYYNAALTPGN